MLITEQMRFTSGFITKSVANRGNANTSIVQHVCVHILRSISLSGGLLYLEDDQKILKKWCPALLPAGACVSHGGIYAVAAVTEAVPQENQLISPGSLGS